MKQVRRLAHRARLGDWDAPETSDWGRDGFAGYYWRNPLVSERDVMARLSIVVPLKWRAVWRGSDYGSFSEDWDDPDYPIERKALSHQPWRVEDRNRSSARSLDGETFN